jgi:hypothetical protein
VLAIVAQGIARPLSVESARELISRLSAGGPISRDADGEVVARSPMASLADKLEPADEPYRPTEDEQAILFVVLDGWLCEVSEPEFPEDAMTLRYSLFCDLDDRRRARAE